jgi:hypothetical protein
MGKRSRRKGADWERELSRRFTEQFGVPVQRNLEEVRSGNSGDLVIPDILPIVVQAKVGERPSPYKALKEAQDVADGTGKYPIGMLKVNGAGMRRAQEVAILRLEDVFDWMRQLREFQVW